MWREVLPVLLVVTCCLCQPGDDAFESVLRLLHQSGDSSVVDYLNKIVQDVISHNDSLINKLPDGTLQLLNKTKDVLTQNGTATIRNVSHENIEISKASSDTNNNATTITTDVNTQSAFSFAYNNTDAPLVILGQPSNKNNIQFSRNMTSNPGSTNIIIQVPVYIDLKNILEKLIPKNDKNRAKYESGEEKEENIVQNKINDVTEEDSYELAFNGVADSKQRQYNQNEDERYKGSVYDNFRIFAVVPYRATDNNNKNSKERYHYDNLLNKVWPYDNSDNNTETDKADWFKDDMVTGIIKNLNQLIKPKPKQSSPKIYLQSDKSKNLNGNRWQDGDLLSIFPFPKFNQVNRKKNTKSDSLLSDERIARNIRERLKKSKLEALSGKL